MTSIARLARGIAGATVVAATVMFAAGNIVGASGRATFAAHLTAGQSSTPHPYEGGCTSETSGGFGTGPNNCTEPQFALLAPSDSEVRHG